VSTRNNNDLLQREILVQRSEGGDFLNKYFVNEPVQTRQGNKFKVVGRFSKQKPREKKEVKFSIVMKKKPKV
jgi:hypothetical protein